MKYRVNEGNRDYAVRLGCEKGVYDFLSDYAKDMGMSRSSALRRLMLIGAHCEHNHGKQPMPISYENLVTPADFSNKDDDPLERIKADADDDEFDWGESNSHN